MKKTSTRPHVTSKGGSPSKSGVKKNKTPSETEFQKLLKGWPPKSKGKKK